MKENGWRNQITAQMNCKLDYIGSQTQMNLFAIPLTPHSHKTHLNFKYITPPPVAYTGIFFQGGLRQEFFWVGGGSTNSLEDRGQREWGSGGIIPPVRGSIQFANE
jgi:hypothetical protein